METTSKESIRITGSQLMDKVKELIHEGNVRRISISQGDRVIAEFPLTLGVVGTLVAPVLAAVAVLAALIADCTIEVERSEAPAADTPTTIVPGDQPSAHDAPHQT